jgi:hypothetical protein
MNLLYKKTKIMPVSKNYYINNLNFMPVPKFDPKCALDKSGANSLFSRVGPIG